MTMQDVTMEDAVAISLADLWPEVTDERLPANHCILSSRVAVEVGAYFGVVITARSTKVAVFNKVARDWIGKPMDTWPKEAWSVGIAGAGAHGPGFDGHVIAESDHWIIDLSTGQFNRKKHQIDVGETLAVRKTDGAKADEMLTVELENGCQIAYLPHADYGWMRAPDWKNRANWDTEAAALIRLMKQKGMRA